MDTSPRIDHSYGLGNRVTAIANALSRFDQIRFAWRENWHCPAPWRAVFPTGLPGVEFLDGTPPAFSTFWESKICGAWDAAGDREKANAAYAAILAAMTGQPWTHTPLAVCARFFRPHASSIEALVATIVAEAGTMGVSQVFLLADTHRQTLAAQLAAHGIQAILPRSAELIADRGRTPEQTLAFISDWKTMLAASRIIILSHRTDLHHPALAAGTPITVCPHP
jgi:hypothetical protein